MQVQSAREAISIAHSKTHQVVFRLAIIAIEQDVNRLKMFLREGTCWKELFDHLWRDVPASRREDQSCFHYTASNGLDSPSDIVQAANDSHPGRDLFLFDLDDSRRSRCHFRGSLCLNRRDDWDTLDNVLDVWVLKQICRPRKLVNT